MNYFEILGETFFSFTWVDFLRILCMFIFASGAGACLKFLINDIKDRFPLVSVSIVVVMLMSSAFGIYFGQPYLQHPQMAVNITFSVLFIVLFITTTICLEEPIRKKQN
jgi:hypothetical protein